MAKDDFAEVQRQLETTASELKTATDQSADERSLREMSRLLAEAERIREALFPPLSCP
jgi:vacuolar-type H+-ATPase subunit H